MTRKRWRDLTADEIRSMDPAETVACILADNEVDGWAHADNVRYLDDGTVDVESLTDSQFEQYSGMLEDELYPVAGRRPPLSPKDLKAWRAVRRREIRENREARERARMPLNRLKNAGVWVLASPIMLLAWIFDAFSSGRHTGVARTRARAVVQGGGNRLMAAVVLSLLALPLVFLATGDASVERLVWCLAIPTICLMVVYAPWYTVVGIIPFWIFYAALSGIAHGVRSESPHWMVGWFWAWTLYPLLRGLFHIMQWDRERKKGLPNHTVTKHPLALTAVSAGVAVVAHYLLKGSEKGR